jgi:hypothetical protein
VICKEFFKFAKLEIIMFKNLQTMDSSFSSVKVSSTVKGHIMSDNHEFFLKLEINILPNSSSGVW